MMDNRGRVIGAMAMLHFFLALVVGAVCSWMIGKIVTPILDLLDYSQYGTAVNDGGTHLRTLVEVDATIFLIAAALYLIIAGVYGRGPAV